MPRELDGDDRVVAVLVVDLDHRLAGVACDVGVDDEDVALHEARLVDVLDLAGADRNVGREQRAEGGLGLEAGRGEDLARAGPGLDVDDALERELPLAGREAREVLFTLLGRLVGGGRAASNESNGAGEAGEREGSDPRHAAACARHEPSHI